MLSLAFFSALLVLAHGTTEASHQSIRNESAILKIDFINNNYNVFQFVHKLQKYTNGSIDFIPDAENKPNITYMNVFENGTIVPWRIHPESLLPEGWLLHMFVEVDISHCTAETCKFTEIHDLVNFLNSGHANEFLNVRSMKVTIVKSARPMWLVLIVIFVAFAAVVAVPAACLRLCSNLKAKRKQQKSYKLTTTLPKPIEVEMKLIKVISGEPSTGIEEV